MSGFLLDNNVLSELWKPAPEPCVWQWFHLPATEWFLPVPVIAEIQEGAARAPEARRNLEISNRLDAFLDAHAALVLDWDAETARTWGRLWHSPEARRQPQALWDSLIDALAVRHGLTVATRNVGDFRHAPTFNPWEWIAPAS